MNGCEHLCSTYGIHLKLECFLSGEREKATVAVPVLFYLANVKKLLRLVPSVLFGEREKATVAVFVRF